MLLNLNSNCFQLTTGTIMHACYIYAYAHAVVLKTILTLVRVQDQTIVLEVFPDSSETMRYVVPKGLKYITV